MREQLASLARLLRESGDDTRAILVEDAISTQDAELQTFLVSNELWGGAGSVADCGGGADRSAERREIERLLIQLGNEQMRTGKINPRTSMWVAAFKKSEHAGI